MFKILSAEERQRVADIVMRWENSHPIRHMPTFTDTYGARRMTPAIPFVQMKPNLCSTSSSGCRFIDCFINSDAFLNAKTVREQICIGVSSLITVYNFNRSSALREIDKLLCYGSVGAVRRLYDQHRDHPSLSSDVRASKNMSAPGRPRHLTRDMLKYIVVFVAQKYVKHCLLTFGMLCELVENDLHVDIATETLRAMLRDADVFVVWMSRLKRRVAIL